MYLYSKKDKRTPVVRLVLHRFKSPFWPSIDKIIDFIYWKSDVEFNFLQFGIFFLFFWKKKRPIRMGPKKVPNTVRFFQSVVFFHQLIASNYELYTLCARIHWIFSMSFWQKYFSRFHFYIIQVSANQQQDRSHTHTDLTLTFTHRVNICCVRCIQCCLYGRSYLSILNNLHNMTMLCVAHRVRWY